MKQKTRENLILAGGAVLFAGAAYLVATDLTQNSPVNNWDTNDGSLSSQDAFTKASQPAKNDSNGDLSAVSSVPQPQSKVITVNCIGGLNC